MASDHSALFPEYWAKEMQTVFYKNNVAKPLVDMSFQSTLSNGDTLHRPHRSAVEIDTYSPGTDITMDEATDTDETLVVNGKYAAGMYIDEFDQIQSNYDIAVGYGKDYGEKMSNKVDADLLGEVVNATSTVDDGDLGGTDGNGITLTTSNVLKVITTAKRKIAKQDVPLENLYMTVSPEAEEVIIQYVAGRDTIFGDDVNKNGYIGKFLGVSMYRTNQSLASAVLSLATNPTDGDTITINGQVFTFVSSIGTTAGNVLIGANVDATRANLAGLINNPGTTSSTQVALTNANPTWYRRKFKLFYSATNDNTANTLTIRAKGVGTLTLDKNLTDLTDNWVEDKTKQHLMIGVKGAITCVMQKKPKVTPKEEPKREGKNILMSMLYGYKTFSDGAKQLANIELNASSY